MIKELFKGSAIYGIAPYVPKILTVLLLPVLTRYLTSTDYGIIGTITSITFAVQALSDLGLRTLLPTYFYKCRIQYKVMWREVYGFLSLWMILFAIIQATLLYFFIPAEAESNKWLIIILGNFSTVFFGPTAMIGYTYYQLNLKPFPVAWRVVLTGVTTILVNCLCVVVFKWGYLGAYIGGFAGGFLGNITYWPVVNRKLGLSPIYNFKWRFIRRLLKISLPTVPHNYTSYLMNSSNVVAMNYYNKPQSEIGHLTMAQSVSGLFDTTLGAINQMVGPMCFKYIRDNNAAEMKRLFNIFIIMAYTMTFMYSLWAREIYDILISNEEIAATYKYSIILVMAYNYRPLYVYFCDYYFYHENTVPLLGVSFISGAISCAFYFVMVPFIGIYAALFGFYFGCIYFGYVGYLFKFYKQKTLYSIKWYLFLVLQLLMTGVAYYGVDCSIFIKFIISAIFIGIAGCIFIFKIQGYVAKSIKEDLSRF